MTDATHRAPVAAPRAFVSPATERRVVRIVLVLVAIAFLAIFLFLPLVSVFYEAFRAGFSAFFRAVTESRDGVGDPPDADRRGLLGAGKSRLRRSPRPGRSPSSSSRARAC